LVKKRKSRLLKFENMFVSSTDYRHILLEIKPDVRFILGKLQMLEKEFKKTYSSPVTKKIERKKINWKSPLNKREWKIFCNIQKHKKALSIHYQPTTTIETKVGKDYLILWIDNLIRLDMMKNKDPIIRIITGHFASRFKERTESDGTGEDLIARYFNEGGLTMWGSVETGSNEIRYVNKFGLGLGEYHDEYKIMRLNTFITQEMLREDQKRWIKQFIDKHTNLENVRHIYQLALGEWKEYVDIEKLEELLKEKFKSGFKIESKDLADILFRDIIEAETRDPNLRRFTLDKK
jgi:hypothetical protein